MADSDFGMAFGFNAKAGSGLGPIGPIAIGPDAKATLTNATALGRFKTPQSKPIGRAGVTPLTQRGARSWCMGEDSAGFR